MFFKAKTKGKWTDTIAMPAARVGILHNAPLKAWKKNTKKLGHTGADLDANYQTAKTWGRMTVGQSMFGVFVGTPIMRYLQEVLKGDDLVDLIYTFCMAKNDRPGEMENSYAALLKKAYINMAKTEKNSPRRIVQKGHESYAIGTGQTFLSIQAKLIKGGRV